MNCPPMKQEALRLKNIHAAQKVAWPSLPSLPSSLTSKKMTPQVGTITYNGGSYRGEIKNGQPNGKGILTKDGNTYNGSWKAGKPNGIMEVDKTDRSKYDGELNANLEYNGEGVLTKYIKGQKVTYRGQFLNDKPRPSSMFNKSIFNVTYPKNVYYMGTLDENYKRSGKGNITSSLWDEVKYVGTWKNGNIIEGKEVYIHNNIEVSRSMLDNQIRSVIQIDGS